MLDENAVAMVVVLAISGTAAAMLALRTVGAEAAAAASSTCVRRLRQEHYGELIALSRTSVGPVHGWSGVLASGGTLLLGVFEGDLLVSFLACRRRGRDMQLWLAATRPECRGKGYLNRLLRTAWAAATKTDCATVSVASSARAAAIVPTLCRRHGMAEEDGGFRISVPVTNAELRESRGAHSLLAL